MYYPKSNSLRLPGYDYSKPGWYFVTLTTRNRSCLFGNLQNSKIALNDADRMIETTWKKLPQYSPKVELDIFQVMPDHFHGILIIKPKSITNVEGESCDSIQLSESAESLSLITLMERFKSLTTNRYIQGVKKKRLATVQQKVVGNFFL